jgi:Rrf2 family nitric oxide-sensitive transcriptional repressor
MRLTAYTDYALRTLMYLATNRDRLVTISEIADVHGISKNHLMKVVHQLGLSGMVETVRGRNGGLRLNHEPAEINIGEVVRNSETDFRWPNVLTHPAINAPFAYRLKKHAAISHRCLPR